VQGIDFIEGSEALEIESQHKKGVARVPLYCVIREPLPPGHVFRDDEGDHLYQMRKVGVGWRTDQKCFVQPTHLPQSDSWPIHQTLVAYTKEVFQSQTIQNAYATIAALEDWNQAVFSWASFSAFVKAYG
jgi:hypothetical protein